MKVRVLKPFTMSSIRYDAGQEAEFSEEQAARLASMGSVELVKENTSPSVDPEARKPEPIESAPEPVHAVKKKSKKKKS